MCCSLHLIPGYTFTSKRRDLGAVLDNLTSLVHLVIRRTGAKKMGTGSQLERK